MTDVTRSIPVDATRSAWMATEEAHLLALDRLIMEAFAGPLLACFNQCVNDDCVLAVEVPREFVDLPADLPKGGIVMLGISSPENIERAEIEAATLPPESIAALLAQIRQREPCSRWLVVRSIRGALSTRLLLPVGASA